MFSTQSLSCGFFNFVLFRRRFFSVRAVPFLIVRWAVCGSIMLMGGDKLRKTVGRRGKFEAAVFLIDYEVMLLGGMGVVNKNVVGIFSPHIAPRHTRMQQP